MGVCLKVSFALKTAKGMGVCLKVSFALKTAKTNLCGGIFFEGLSGSQINRFFIVIKPNQGRERESHCFMCVYAKSGVHIR